MLTIAYLANEFPSPVEPYVINEILELRKAGVHVIPCSARPVLPDQDPQQALLAQETLYLLKPKWKLLLYGLWSSISRLPAIWEFIDRALWQGSEGATLRLKALAHTLLGAYYARALSSKGVHHIHVHHGYFSAWAAMVAARLLGISYSLTLHGSDLLLHNAFLDIKLENCSKCFTVSEYNRKFILNHFAVSPSKVIVQNMGVVPPPIARMRAGRAGAGHCLRILSVGRLQPVKDHVFLVHACSRMKRMGWDFSCLIAGEGPERQRLESQIAALDLGREVQLLGHVPHTQLNNLYPAVDLVVLTSRSEGIPLTLMEAMSWGRLVLAPAITGIPELVLDGKTGFLYTPGSTSDFIKHVQMIRNTLSDLTPVRTAAREHVATFFDQTTNLQDFIRVLVSHIPAKGCNAHSLLQQIRHPV